MREGWGRLMDGMRAVPVTNVLFFLGCVIGSGMILTLGH